MGTVWCSLNPDDVGDRLVLGVICFLASLKFGRYGDFAMIVAMGHFILGVVGGSVIAFLVGYVWIARKVFWRCHSDGTMGGNGAGEYAVTAMADPTRRLLNTDVCQLKFIKCARVDCLLLGGPRMRTKPLVKAHAVRRMEDSDILGKCLISRFDGGVEKKRFHADGTVYITLSKDGDAPVAPIFYWTIDDEGYLYIGIDELSDLSKTKDQMHSGYKSRLISRDNDKLTVEVNGKVDTLYYEHSSCAPI